MRTTVGSRTCSLRISRLARPALTIARRLAVNVAVTAWPVTVTVVFNARATDVNTPERRRGRSASLAVGDPA